MIDVIIDISHWQEKVDFSRVKEAGILGVILKATDGMDTDPKFIRISEAREVGLLVGSYHYVRKAHDMLDQVKFYLKNAQPGKGELIAFDIESGGEISRETLLDGIKYVVDTLGRYPVLYGGRNVLAVVVGDEPSDAISKCPLWWSQYGPEITHVPELFGPQGPVIWQYTENGECAGVVGPVDRDRYMLGDEDHLRAWWRGTAS